DPGTSDPDPSGTAPGMNPTNPGAPPPVPFEPIEARAYAGKVMDLLTGQPLAGDELAALTANPKALRGLIDKWMAMPGFRDKMMTFFARAFQQTQLDPTDLEDQFKLGNNGISGADQQRMLRSVQESFARPVLALIDAKRPFTE